MIIRKSLLLICFILTSLLPSRADAIDPMPTKVAILIRPSLWQSLQSEITDYMADVCNKEAVEFEVIRENFETPQQVRSVLERLWKDKGIEGAILIGSLPVHQFFMHEHANPNPLYFEDFSLHYRDKTAMESQSPIQVNRSLRSGLQTSVLRNDPMTMILMACGDTFAS